MYYLHVCVKMKRADQLRGYRAADLRLCFRIYEESRFSHDGAYIVLDLPDTCIINLIRF